MRIRCKLVLKTLTRRVPEVKIRHYCWFSLHGAVTLHLADRLRWGRSLDDLVEPMLETLYRGAAARPQTEHDR